MEKSLIKPLNQGFNPLNFPLPNAISNLNHGDEIELKMITFQSKAYTSLKDLLPASPPSAASPTSARKDSWREIPIKDPLLQHAAWAYLMPMESDPDEDKRWWRRIKEKCGGVFGCVNDVVFAVFKDLFPEREIVDDDDNDGGRRRKFDRRDE